LAKRLPPQHRNPRASTCGKDARGVPGLAGSVEPNLCQRDVVAEDRRVSFAERAPDDDPAWAQGVRKVTVLTGAGISTGSGGPDFRGPQGVWTRNPGARQLASYRAYVSDRELRRRSWQARRNHPAWTAEPNAAHAALAELAGSTIDTQVITQNIDGLHQKAG